MGILHGLALVPVMLSLVLLPRTLPIATDNNNKALLPSKLVSLMSPMLLNLSSLRITLALSVLAMKTSSKPASPLKKWLLNPTEKLLTIWLVLLASRMKK